MLFRKEVLEAKRKRLFGHVLIAVPIGFWAITGFLFAVIAALFIFLTTANFARIEKVRGAVVPSAGILHVRAQNSGILTEFLVAEGTYVTQSDVVGRITVTGVSDSSGTRLGAELSSIDNDIALLEQQIEQVSQVTALDVAAKQREMNVLQSRIDGTTQMLSLQQELLEEIEQRFSINSQLAERDLVNNSTMSQHMVQLVNARRDVLGSRIELDNLSMQLDGIDLFVRQATEQEKLEQLRLEAELTRLVNRRAILLGEQAYNVVAPASGHATAVLVSEGSALAGSSQLFSILPTHTTLQVELYVPSRAIGFVEAGQAVRLLFDAFPYQNYGTKDGRITQITKSVITQASTELLVDIQEPVYRVTVELESQVFAARGHELSIQPGMLLSANIILEDRTILAWLLEPLLSVARRT